MITKLIDVDNDYNKGHVTMPLWGKVLSYIGGAIIFRNQFKAGVSF